MGYRTLIASLIVVAIVAVPFFLADSDAEDETHFVEGGYTYKVLGGTSLEAVEFDNALAVEHLVTPSYVVHDGVTYTVTVLNCMYQSDVIRSVTVSSTILGMPFIATVFLGSNISDILVEEGNEAYSSKDGVLFDDKMRTLIMFPKGKALCSYEFPETVSSVHDFAFADNLALEEVLLNEGLMDIGAHAFEGCSNLRSINPIGEMNVLPTSVSIIDEGAFSRCENLHTVLLPEGLRIIGANAFFDTAIEHVTVPGKVLDIGVSAFGGCKNLEYIDVRGSQKYTSLDGVLYETGDENKILMMYPSGKTDSEFVLDHQVSQIWPEAFNETQYLKKVVLPDTIQILPYNAFLNSESLEEVDISHIVIVDDGAFYGCTNLKTVVMSERLVSIGYNAFCETGLEEVTLPASVQTVDPLSFSNCKSLKKFTVPEDSEALLRFGIMAGSFAVEEIELLSDKIELGDGALEIGSETNPVTVKVTKLKTYTIPTYAVSGDYTTLDVKNLGERPYPYENLIVVAICIIVLLMIIRIFRGV